MHKLLTLGFLALSFVGTNTALAQNIQSKDLTAPAGTQSASQPAKAVVGTIKVVTGLVNLQTAEGKSPTAHREAETAKAHRG